MDGDAVAWVMDFRRRLVEFGGPQIDAATAREIAPTPEGLAGVAQALFEEAGDAERHFAALSTGEGVAAARLLWEIRDALSAHTVYFGPLKPTVEDVVLRFADSMEEFFPRLRSLAAMLAHPASATRPEGERAS